MDDPKHQRRLEIFNAAYQVLSEKGYKGTSMLAVAKAASASNETMYNWFNNKQGLLAAMIEDNADKAGRFLSDSFSQQAITSTSQLAAKLEEFGDVLLRLLTSEKSVSLNRAAAADVANGNVLGDLLAENGRNKIMPLLAKFFEDAQQNGLIKQNDPREIAEVYIALLIGDVQIRRVIGVMNSPDPGNTKIHSQRVVELVLQLFGTGSN
ncbi:MAG: TetR/AcrR family transcriptional regulator [Salaquimonas sp.]